MNRQEKPKVLFKNIKNTITEAAVCLYINLICTYCQNYATKYKNCSNNC